MTINIDELIAKPENNRLIGATGKPIPSGDSRETTLYMDEFGVVISPTGHLTVPTPQPDQKS